VVLQTELMHDENPVDVGREGFDERQLFARNRGISTDDQDGGIDLGNEIAGCATISAEDRALAVLIPMARVGSVDREIHATADRRAALFSASRRYADVSSAT